MVANNSEHDGDTKSNVVSAPWCMSISAVFSVFSRLIVLLRGWRSSCQRLKGCHPSTYVWWLRTAAFTTWTNQLLPGQHGVGGTHTHSVAWTRSMTNRSWTHSYFGRVWTERTFFCLMNVIVNGAFSQFNFVQDSARFPSSLPGKNRLKHTVNRPQYVAKKHPVWLLCTKRTLGERFVQLALLSIKTKLNYFRQKQLHTKHAVRHYQTNTD